MSEWNWLPIEQAPKDRPILVIGGTYKNCKDPDCQCGEAVKVLWDDDCEMWVLTEAVYYLRWVENPTHFCELPTPPKNLSADLAQKPTDPEEPPVSR